MAVVVSCTKSELLELVQLSLLDGKGGTPQHYCNLQKVRADVVGGGWE